MKNVAGSKKRFSKGHLLREQGRENTDKADIEDIQEGCWTQHVSRCTQV